VKESPIKNNNKFKEKYDKKSYLNATNITTVAFIKRKYPIIVTIRNEYV
jgi:hypothetical protein